MFIVFMCMNLSAQITYQLKENEHVGLSIFDITGRKLSTLVYQEQAAGIHILTFNADALPEGIYFAKLRTNKGEKSIRMHLSKN